MKRLATSVLIAGGLAGCAGTDHTPQMTDPIVIPENAVSVDYMTLYDNNVWIPINGRMLLAHAGTKHYLLTFHSSCRPLNSKNAPQVMVFSHSNALYANSDLIHVGNSACPVNDIYEILEEDAIALRTRAKR